MKQLSKWDIKVISIGWRGRILDELEYWIDEDNSEDVQKDIGEAYSQIVDCLKNS